MMKINGPGESTILLLKIIKLLNKLNLPYAVIGAFAASFYGHVRASLDADAVISFEGQNEKLDGLFESLKKEGLKVELRQGDISDPVRGVINILDKFSNSVDLLTGIRGMNPDLFKRAVKASFLDAEIRIVCVEDFIAMKIYGGGPQDIEDVKHVLALQKKKVKMPLLKQLTLGYGKKELSRLKQILKDI